VVPEGALEGEPVNPPPIRVELGGHEARPVSSRISTGYEDVAVGYRGSGHIGARNIYYDRARRLKNTARNKKQFCGVSGTALLIDALTAWSVD
jgi:hypothetical protein